MKKGIIWIALSFPHRGIDGAWHLAVIAKYDKTPTSTTTTTTSAVVTTTSSTTVPTSTTSSAVVTTAATTTSTGNWWDSIIIPQYGGTMILQTIPFDITSFDPYGGDLVNLLKWLMNGCIWTH